MSTATIARPRRNRSQVTDDAIRRVIAAAYQWALQEGDYRPSIHTMRKTARVDVKRVAALRDAMERAGELPALPSRPRASGYTKGGAAAMTLRNHGRPSLAAVCRRLNVAPVDDDEPDAPAAPARHPYAAVSRASIRRYRRAWGRLHEGARP